MYGTVETRPNLQPAACSWGGFGVGPAKMFLRIENPDEISPTLLVSDIIFAEWAKLMGYSKITETETLTKELRTEANELANDLSLKLGVLANLRAMLPDLDVFEERVQSFLESVGKLCNPIDKPSDESDGKLCDPINKSTDESDGITEPSDESQLDGIQPATNGDESGNPSTPVRPADPRRSVRRDSQAQ